ncbi:hypothetical protein MG293_003735 [Ovis ammon polii]|uniref:Uncharacterized protein n=1 Tax=Ovis ammon polii TaxID=230172 RepID=A0AAD4YDP7_OVIAM|nr:hypothetical protein MG293_003735 [Ovis ammon polii]
MVTKLSTSSEQEGNDFAAFVAGFGRGANPAEPTQISDPVSNVFWMYGKECYRIHMEKCVYPLSAPTPTPDNPTQHSPFSEVGTRSSSETGRGGSEGGDVWAVGGGCRCVTRVQDVDNVASDTEDDLMMGTASGTQRNFKFGMYTGLTSGRNGKCCRRERNNQTFESNYSPSSGNREKTWDRAGSLKCHILPLDSPGAEDLMGCQTLESNCQGKREPSRVPCDTVPQARCLKVASPVQGKGYYNVFPELSFAFLKIGSKSKESDAKVPLIDMPKGKLPDV